MLRQLEARSTQTVTTQTGAEMNQMSASGFCIRQVVVLLSDNPTLNPSSGNKRKTAGYALVRDAGNYETVILRLDY
jgi:hypothetical protein